MQAEILPPIYNKIGASYNKTRGVDARIAKQITQALGDAKTIINIGAGSGAYEPLDRDVIAVEPSITMIAQRRRNAAPVIRAVAEALPFRDDHFDTAMAVLTVHHWLDQVKGLREMCRVARNNVVIVSFDPEFVDNWLLDYFPQLHALDKAEMPALRRFEDVLGPCAIKPLMIPHDCSDGFLHAFWRRPEAYFDENIRAGISSFWKIDDVEAGLRALRRDLDTGRWHARYAKLLARDALDCGYRLIQRAQ